MPLKKLIYSILILYFLLLLLPTNPISPIKSNIVKKIDPLTFWYYPWGQSVVHKGIDIFCAKHTEVVSPVQGMVINSGYSNNGGNYITILGTKWRTYYFAHLDTILVRKYAIVKKGSTIGLVGNTGNASSRPFHLHYSIFTSFPYIWLHDRYDKLGWQKMFYLDPNEYMAK
jgi:murein DD-endopeptidase MepM/ murein hydrolase activator NlpD